ncbi:hypothetical protein D3C76_1729520 [compost metagenome]
MIVTNQLAALVMHRKLITCLRISKSLGDTRQVILHLFGDGNGTLQLIVLSATLTPASVPERTRHTCPIQQVQLPTGIDAVHQQRLTL